LYIDTENTFRPERIVTIAKAHGMDPEKALDRIMVARAYNSAHQTLILEEASHMIQENNIKFVVKIFNFFLKKFFNNFFGIFRIILFIISFINDYYGNGNEIVIDSNKITSPETQLSEIEKKIIKIFLI